MQKDLEDSNETKRFASGVKVHSKSIDRDLILSHTMTHNNELGILWLCIDPNLSMNENRCAIFQCFEDDLTIGW